MSFYSYPVPIYLSMRTTLYNLSVLLFLSCTSRSPLSLETKEVDFRDKTMGVVEATQMNIDIPGVQDVIVCDSLLFFITRDQTGMLKVYNKNTLEQMASLCQQGRARNEFTGQIHLVNGLFYKRGNEIIIPLMDYNSLIQKEININKSLLAGQTVVENAELRSSDETCFILLNNSLEKLFSFRKPHAAIGTESIPLPQYLVMEQNEIKKSINVFTKHIESENLNNLEMAYNGDMTKHPERNLVVMPMSGMDYILFFDIDKNSYYALHQIDSPAASDICIYNDYQKNRLYFGGARAVNGKDYFLVSYAGGKYTEEAMKTNTMRNELLAFDWNGNYLGGIKLGANYHRSSFDPATYTLYTINLASEKICMFNLSELIDTIEK